MLLVVTIILTQIICRPSAEAPNHAVAVGTKISTLAVKVTTRDRRGAGTDNAVYFDVGPWSWRLNNRWRNDFERGRTDTFNLKVPEGFAADDILWLRLHKKGLFGVTGTRDGLTGAWHPGRIALLVNGIECANAEVTQSLNSRYWSWRTHDGFNPYIDPTSFVRSLRLKPNDPLPWHAKVSAFVTTPLFKEHEISGWLDCPEQKQSLMTSKPCATVPKKVCATGKLFRPPAVSTDGLATIDLHLDTVEFCSETRACAQRLDLRTAQEFARPRYLRVEYRFKEKKFPKPGQQLRVCGRLRWDTDQEGWWEIHTTQLEF